MIHRSGPRHFLFAALTLIAAAVAQEPTLLPKELEALRFEATGEPRNAISAYLDLAQSTANGTLDADGAARIEAWATQAGHLLRARPAANALQKFDTLAKSPAVTANPLLRDRIALAAFAATTGHPAADSVHRANDLGFLREFWLIGPFANERGAGYRTPEAPETALELDKELPGKQRPVHWRQLPPLPGSATLPLGRIVDPHEQSLVYAAVALDVEQPRDVVLEIGTTGSFKVFCNRTEVAGREVERPFAYDQDATLLHLQKGSNLLVLKLCHQEGQDFWAAARLRNVDGSPAEGVRRSVEREDLLAAAATTAATPIADEPAPALGGRTHWKIGETNGADAMRLAWLWRARAADGEKSRRDFAAAQGAAKALPDVAESHLLVAAASERIARSSADRDDNARRRALETALEKNGEHVEALVRLGNLLRSTSNLWHDARSLAERALKVQPTHIGALMLRVATLRDEGLAQLADAELVAAANSPDASPWLLRSAADVVDDREVAPALALRQRVLQESESESDLCAVATLLARAGKIDEAKAQLTLAMRRSPFAAQASRQLATLQLTAGDAAAAIATTEAWLAIAPDDANALALASKCWRRRDDVADAATRQQELLRSALEVEPTRRDDERYAEFLASATTNGDANSFYAGFQRDAAAIVKADAGPPADAATANDPLHWILRQQVVRANGNGTRNVYTHEIARIATEDGARQLANYRLAFWNGEQRARLLACTVFRKDGSVQHPALQGARVRMPDLRPGDVVAVEGRVDDLAPSFFGDYFGLVHSFMAPDGSPVRSAELVVLADPGREYRTQSVNGAPQPEKTTRPDGTLQFQWSMRELPRDLVEIQRPDRKEYEPIVRVTTYRDWDHFASWWWNLVKNQLEVTPSMRATIARLTDGLADTDAKIAAIYKFVTTEVRYEAWEFGVHGYKPYSTAVIHERRHGDCKDKALLLCAMLGEIGVACKPVIIFADPLRSRDDLELAMVEHFNHCIAWMPEQNGRPARFLDGTATWHPADTIPEMDQGARVLVVDAGHAELRDIAETTPEANRETKEYTFALRDDGGARLEGQYAPFGNQAIPMREMLGTEPARRREVIERDLVQTFGKLTLGDLTASDPLDLGAPVHMNVTADIGSIGQRNGAKWRLPSSWNVGELHTLGSEPERHQPLLLGVPNGTLQTVRYRLPRGWRAVDLPAPVERQAPFGSFTMRWRSDGPEVTVERRLALSKSRIQVADHAAFREFVASVKAADDQSVLLEQEGSR